jgi:hypothetical protein
VHASTIRALPRARRLPLRLPLRLLLPLALPLAAGCSTYGRTEAAAQPRTTLTVENLTTADMTMYVRFGGARSRLGIARSNGRTVLPIPSSVVGFGTVLRFESNAVAGPGGTLSEEMSVSPGDSVHILIAR